MSFVLASELRLLALAWEAAGCSCCCLQHSISSSSQLRDSDWATDQDWAVSRSLHVCLMFVSSYLYRCRFLLCASGEAVKVFSTSTEECIHELRGHTGLVTGVLLRPSNHLQVQSPLHLEKRLFSRRLYPETRWYSFNVRKYRKQQNSCWSHFFFTCNYLLSLVQSPSSDQTRIRSLFIFYLFTYSLSSLLTLLVQARGEATKLLFFCSWKSPNLNSESVTISGATDPKSHGSDQFSAQQKKTKI